MFYLILFAGSSGSLEFNDSYSPINSSTGSANQGNHTNILRTPGSSPQKHMGHSYAKSQHAIMQWNWLLIVVY